MQPLNLTNAFLADLMERRGAITASSNSNRLSVELTGGHVVEMTPFEPDASTYRNWYYYNTSINVLKRKIVIETYPSIVAYWKPISN